MGFQILISIVQLKKTVKKYRVFFFFAYFYENDTTHIFITIMQLYSIVIE